MTPVPITAPTIQEVANNGVAIIQTFGLAPFILFAAFAGAAFMLYRRFRRSSM